MTSCLAAGSLLRGRTPLKSRNPPSETNSMKAYLQHLCVGEYPVNVLWQLRAAQGRAGLHAQFGSP